MMYTYLQKKLVTQDNEKGGHEEAMSCRCSMFFLRRNVRPSKKSQHITVAPIYPQKGGAQPSRPNSSYVTKIIMGHISTSEARKAQCKSANEV